MYMQRLTKMLLFVFFISFDLIICKEYGMLHGKNPSFAHINTMKDACNLFPKTVAEIEQYTENALADARTRIAQILAIAPLDRTFLNSVKALDELEAYSNFYTMILITIILELVSSDKAIRDAAHMACLTLKHFNVDTISHNAALYRALCEYVEHGMKNEQLTAEQHYFIEERLQAYRRQGLDLPAEKQLVVKALKKDLAELESQFEANVSQDTTKLLFKPSELAGLDQDFIDNLVSDDHGNKVLTLAYPTYDAVMENCSVADTRKKMFIAFSQRAYPANKLLLSEIIAKRDSLAKELGFAHYADFDLSSEMVITAARAEQFINDLVDRVKPKALLELQQLTQMLPDSVLLSDSGKLFPWDYRYLLNMYKQNHLSVDENKIAKYFPMEKTIAGLFAIYEDFFNIKFQELPVEGLWDDSLKGFSVTDGNSGVVLGYFLLDLFPRENKFSHAAHLDIVQATYNSDGIPNKHLSIVLANFSKSTATKPSLLKSSEVSTFFHELGHALHALLGRTKMASFSGARVKMDFVELPSQMLEEWLWDKDILQSLSSHYQTNESLSDDQIAAIIALKNFDSGYSILRQANFALLSLNYFKHALLDDPQMLMKKLYNSTINTLEFCPENHMYAAFGHLTEYGPKYYGYLWSKVFALDLFDVIKKEGLRNPIIGKRYVDQVIGRGGSVDPNILLENFLGRKPTQNAFLRDMGL